MSSSELGERLVSRGGTDGLVVCQEEGGRVWMAGGGRGDEGELKVA